MVAVKAIKHLSTSPQLIEVLQNSNALEVLVGLLGRTMKGLHGNVSSFLAEIVDQLTSNRKYARTSFRLSFRCVACPKPDKRKQPRSASFRC